MTIEQGIWHAVSPPIYRGIGSNQSQNVGNLLIAGDSWMVVSGGVAGLFYKIKAFRTLQLQLVSRSDRSSLPDMLFVFGLEPIRSPVVML